MKSNSAQTVRRQPQRTCVACRQTKAKRELMRVVRTTGGTVEIDETGKTEGRGAYICRKAACWEIALRSNRLEHTLRSKIEQENHDRLKARCTALLKEITNGQVD